MYEEWLVLVLVLDEHIMEWVEYAMLVVGVEGMALWAFFNFQGLCGTGGRGLLSVVTSLEDIGKPPSENVPSNPKPTNNAAPATIPTRVNDVFWEQFLTERPGSSNVDDTL
ncbi:hypothetical protein Tco_0092581 [Tanacetum coccineum]